MTKITRYKQSLYQDWKDGEISQQEYREMKADYERQAAGLSDLLARLTAERKQLSNGVDQQHPALVAFAKYQNIEKLTREILIELVDHIKVYENGNESCRPSKSSTVNSSTRSCPRFKRTISGTTFSTPN